MNRSQTKVQQSTIGARDGENEAWQLTVPQPKVNVRNLSTITGSYTDSVPCWPAFKKLHSLVEITQMCSSRMYSYTSNLCCLEIIMQVWKTGWCFCIWLLAEYQGTVASLSPRIPIFNPLFFKELQNAKHAHHSHRYVALNGLSTNWNPVYIAICPSGACW